MNSAPVPPHGARAFVARHRIVLWRLVFLALAGLCALGTPYWTDHWLSALLRLGGIVLVSAAALGRMWCALYISGRKSRELVTAGPYSLCRHPLYLFNLLGFLGVAALAESLIAAGAVALAFAALYPSVMADEERLLARSFPEFEAYRRRTPALLPRPGGYASPREWTVDVPAFLRNVGDSVWFPLLAVVVELFDVAHEAGWIVGRFVLY